MKLTVISIFCCLFLATSMPVAAEEVKTVEFDTAKVVYDYQPAREGVATLSLNALVSETNDSLRSLKNTDRRRLGKLGQLIYQCKLLLYRPESTSGDSIANVPMLISRNFSLYTGVDLRLAKGERLGIRVRSLPQVDSERLFAPSLGGNDSQQEVWEDVGGGSAIDLVQINVNALLENDFISGADNIDIQLRFPIFQLERPVQQWSYNFDLRDFKRAIEHADENCTPTRLSDLIESNS
ncbi:MAG TPA: hypothetical protein VKB27_05690 [Gammaproteobacteria bacterium]|nr:hypothetical protein [Gammaproteobacteria bacterium]